MIAKLVAFTTAVIRSSRGWCFGALLSYSCGEPCNSQAQAVALFSSLRLKYSHTADTVYQQVALMHQLSCGQLAANCCYHVTRFAD